MSHRFSSLMVLLKVLKNAYETVKLKWNIKAT